MFVAFLGTGNALPSRDRANTALALMAEPGGRVVVVDCGGDPFRSLLNLRVAADRVSDIIITHAHIDHIGGLPSLIESFRIANRTTPLHIHAIAHPLGIARDLLGTFAFELTLDRWPFPVTLHEIQPGTTGPISDFLCTPYLTDHTIPCIGMRLVAASAPNGPVFGYTCDTRVAPVLSQIAQDAAFFIAEATYPRGHEEAARQVGHMTAYQAGEIATSGRAHTLGLVHLSASNAQESQVQREATAAFRGDVIVPRDGFVYQVARRVHRVARLP
jgi:ribonuclease Z